jgi:hypothetical protein
MKENGDAKSEDGERGRSGERQDEIMLPIADDAADIASPVSALDSGEREGLQAATLPPPALDP